ncbi:hypothetical protein RFI_28800 [Reticulomyxa filosa]|uniref:Thiopurine S-methyltransferase n=1 Tax=Reticulomyxa filosa TaxID=46433 RepID=X6M4K4_RETFI|nr:hypothetical protein RFI_28800 [Reticulomyxa filosa]|eukprot:ETO08581.1 hypothetical protein RFI_28800 [Reticulomyxa filosa]
MISMFFEIVINVSAAKRQLVANVVKRKKFYQKFIVLTIYFLKSKSCGREHKAFKSKRFCGIMRLNRLKIDISAKKWTAIWEKSEYPGWDNGKITRAARHHLDDLFSQVPPQKALSNQNTISIFVPLCGATTDLRAISDHLNKKVQEKVAPSKSQKQSESPRNDKDMENTQSSDTHQIKVIGIELSKTALELFLKESVTASLTLNTTNQLTFPFIVPKIFI